MVTAAMIVADMKTYQIYFWHGYNESLAAELMAIEGVSRTDDTINYIGTLDNFAEQYGRHFIVKPQSDQYGDLICVTQYGSWSAR